jgi:hypothetical protein
MIDDQYCCRAHLVGAAQPHQGIPPNMIVDRMEPGDTRIEGATDARPLTAAPSLPKI